MSEHEKELQIGKLAEEYSNLKGELNHVSEKMTRAQQAYQQLANLNAFNTLRVINGILVANLPPQNLQRNVEGLLGTDELKHFVAEKERLNTELRQLAERLKALAPHLLQP
jgi:ABC-type phosphate transport system auxiliary subunit